MKLYIVRHAIAIPRGTPGIEDDDRPLTEEGAECMGRAAAAMAALGWIPEIVLSSPLPRARKTAEILLEALGKSAELEITPALAPSGAREHLYRAIRSYYKKCDSLTIVGHQPSLGEIAGEICRGAPAGFIEIKKGGACAIELESARNLPRGRLTALLTPSILRRLKT